MFPMATHSIFNVQYLIYILAGYRIRQNIRVFFVTWKMRFEKNILFFVITNCILAFSSSRRCQTSVYKLAACSAFSHIVSGYMPDYPARYPAQTLIFIIQTCTISLCVTRITFIRDILPFRRYLITGFYLYLSIYSLAFTFSSIFLLGILYLPRYSVLGFYFYLRIPSQHFTSTSVFIHGILPTVYRCIFTLTQFADPVGSWSVLADLTPDL